MLKSGMKFLLLIIGLVLTMQSKALTPQDFEQGYYHLLNQFMQLQQQRAELIAAQDEAGLTIIEQKKLQGLDCSIWQAESNYYQYIVEKFSQYSDLMRRSGAEVIDSRADCQDARSDLLRQINDPKNTCQKTG